MSWDKWNKSQMLQERQKELNELLLKEGWQPPIHHTVMTEYLGQPAKLQAMIVWQSPTVVRYSYSVLYAKVATGTSGLCQPTTETRTYVGSSHEVSTPAATSTGFTDSRIALPIQLLDSLIALMRSTQAEENQPATVS